MDERQGNELLLITGTMGAGKSTVMAEASDLLERERVEHAAIDVDVLGLAYIRSTPTNHEAMYANLECICRNYSGVGARRFLLVRAVENRAELERCCYAAAASNAMVCRLTASMPTLLQRVSRRERGVLRAEYLARVETLNASLDLARLEDFTVVNENRPVTEVAREMLVRAGWLP